MDECKPLGGGGNSDDTAQEEDNDDGGSATAETVFQDGRSEFDARSFVSAMSSAERLAERLAERSSDGAGTGARGSGVGGGGGGGRAGGGWGSGGGGLGGGGGWVGLGEFEEECPPGAIGYDVHYGGHDVAPSHVVQQPVPPLPRADDIYQNSWFMQTVLKDLGCLRAAAKEHRTQMSALEENVCAIRSESAALRAEVRRLSGGGGGAVVRGSGRAGVVQSGARADYDRGGGWGATGVGGGGWGSTLIWTTALGCVLCVVVVAGRVIHQQR